MTQQWAKHSAHSSSEHRSELARYLNSKSRRSIQRIRHPSSARQGFHSLLHLFLSEHGLVDAGELVQRITTRPTFRQVKSLQYLPFRLYVRARSIFDVLTSEIPLEELMAPRSKADPSALVGVQSSRRKWVSPYLRKTGWTRALGTASPIWTARSTKLKCTPERLWLHLAVRFATGWSMLPTVYDVQARLRHRLLPVKTRFFFLQQGPTNPTICLWAGCYVPETQEHCFCQCRRVRQVWQRLRPIWSQLVRKRLTWTELHVGSKEITHEQWIDNLGLALTVWFCFRGSFLLKSWKSRNTTVFGSRPPPTETALAQTITRFFATHLRSLHRRRSQLQVNETALEHITTTLAMRWRGLQSHLESAQPHTFHVQRGPDAVHAELDRCEYTLVSPDWESPTSTVEVRCLLGHLFSTSLAYLRACPQCRRNSSRCEHAAAWFAEEFTGQLSRSPRLESKPTHTR